MKRNLLLAAIGLLAFGCDSPTMTTPEAADRAATPELAHRGPVIHRVFLGSADACEALGQPVGCDANFSLTASEFADGSVHGVWVDVFAGGVEGIRVAVDCLKVVGNGAVIGGVITSGTFGGVDVSGQRAFCAVVDNGVSANDPADQISFSVFPIPAVADCADQEPGFFQLLNLVHGQVTVH